MSNSVPNVTGIGSRLGAVAAFAGSALAVVLPASPALAGPTTAEVVRLPFPRYDGSLTPYTFDLGYPLVSLVYDALMWRDARGIPRPWLARTVTRARGGRRVTVRLRPGVRWHDGRPVTAADVAFTYRFVAGRYQARFTPQLADIQRVRVRGRLTVSFDLRRPSLGFDDQPLADVPILPRHLWKGLSPGRLAPSGPAVGSGPYRLVSARRDAGYVLRANRAYFRGAPRVREIRVPIIGDAEKAYEALRERRVDMIPLSLPREAAEDFEATLGVRVQRGPSYAGTTLLLNLRRPPFDRPDVRRAIAGALDLRQIARNGGPAVPAVEGQIHPSSRWAAGQPLQRANVPAAQRSLARLGLPPISVLAPANDPVRLEAGRQVVVSLRRAGVKVALTEISRAQLARAIGEDGSPPDFDAAIQSTPALASADPDYLTTLFGSSARSAPLNFSGYRSAAFDALARRVASAPDAQARRVATRAELRLLARDLPSIPLFFSEGTFAHRVASYDGWTFIQGTGILDKRSFLPGEQPAPRRQPEVVGGGERAGSDAGLGVVNLISIVVLAVVALLAGAALWQRRRAGGG